MKASVLNENFNNFDLQDKLNFIMTNPDIQPFLLKYYSKCFTAENIVTLCNKFLIFYYFYFHKLNFNFVNIDSVS